MTAINRMSLSSLSRECVHIISAEWDCISSMHSIGYHQTEAVFMHGYTVMIYKHSVLDDIQRLVPLMICQTSLRFGLDTKNLGKSDIFCLKLTK